MNTKSFLAACLLAFSTLNSTAQGVRSETSEITDEKNKRMEWFAKAKLGIFIHWGIYSLGDTSESWAFYNKRISMADYMKQAEKFTAANYDPAYWAKLIKESGAQYTVITTKHHDGFALWDTQVGPMSAVKNSPAKRDLIAPFAEAVRREGLKLGFYYSLIDWPHKDYPQTYAGDPPKYDIKLEPQRWQSFLDFNQAQLGELTTRWKPDLIWFDGDWEHSAEEWNAPRVVASLRADNPNVIINSRIQGHGDYATPEQGVPTTRPDAKWWESCMTMNDSWGYQSADKNYKSTNTLLRMLVDCISLGGNLLLDIGPKADGTIPPEQEQILKELGRWTSKHAEAIYSTRAGIPAGHVQAYTALNQAGDVLYLYVPYTPNKTLEIKGLKSPIKSAKIVGTNQPLTWTRYNDISWSEMPGVYYLNVPAEACDPEITVIALSLAEPIKLYRGHGQVITANE